MIEGYIKLVKKISKALENVAAIIIFFTAMLIIANVISRRLFNIPIVGAHDLILLFTTSAIALALAHVAVNDGHIFIDFFMEKFNKKAQKVIDIIIGTISAVFLFLVTWHMVLYTNDVRQSGEVSLTIHWPQYPFVFILAIGFGILMLVVIGKILTLFVKEGEQ